MMSTEKFSVFPKKDSVCSVYSLARPGRAVVNRTYSSRSTRTIGNLAAQRAGI